ncbi:hypothetical protein VE25_06355 [Devosia geojensis]|uniref:Uncharacterized protein n=1 Tax=Devosia geojensis TaxID=443610 RepID=A0A0F5FUL6_9HYPH|nr:hypothetical protein [Devosia geojensis]KKB12544.1 hypothetical protein VE25_06355 [Devosia geojensis]
MPQRKKITTGPNDRPVDESIGQTAPGLPDDSSRSPDVDDRDVERVKRKIVDDPRARLKKEVDEAIKASERGSE